MIKSKNELDTSYLSKLLKVEGNIVSKGEIIIDSQFKGDIQAEKLIVSKEGIIEANCNCKEIIIYGKLSGNVTAQNIELKDKSILDGKIIYKTLSIEKGSILNATVLNSETTTSVKKKSEPIKATES